MEKQYYNHALLTGILQQLALPLPDQRQTEQLEQYAADLVLTNEQMNLTAITDPDGIALRHFADSLTLLPLLPEGAVKICDVGSGAGFPMIPVLILRPELQATLMDSTGKKVRFLSEELKRLGLKGQAKAIRAEEAGQNPLYREQFDFCTARAVARLQLLLEYVLPLVRVNGQFCAMKGPDGQAEAEEAEKTASVLGAGAPSMRLLTLPEEQKRTLILYQKERPTPTKYPRDNRQIRLKPIL